MQYYNIDRMELEVNKLYSTTFNRLPVREEIQGSISFLMSEEDRDFESLKNFLLSTEEYKNKNK